VGDRLSAAVVGCGTSSQRGECAREGLDQRVLDLDGAAHRGVLRPSVLAHPGLERHRHYGAAAVVVGVARNRPRRSAPWILPGDLAAVLRAGDTTYNLLTSVGHETNPFPSVADIFYMITCVTQVAGMYGLVRRRNGQPGPKRLHRPVWC